MIEFPENWLTEGMEPRKLSKQVVGNDVWDKEDLRRMVAEIAPFAAARKRLGKFAETGHEAMADTFWALYKAAPELLPTEDIRPSHIVNRSVLEQAQSLDEMERLRHYSVGDDVQAALSCVSMEPDLETLFDRTQKQRDKADQLEQAMQDLAAAQGELAGAQADVDAMIEKLRAQAEAEQQQKGQGEGEECEGQGEGDGEGQGSGEPEVPEDLAARQAAAAQAVAEAMAAVEAANAEFQEAMTKGNAGVRSTLAEALGKAAEEAREQLEQARAWGLEPGQLQRMDPKERMELAKRLNGPRLKRIADLFGPMRNLMLSEQQRKTTHHKEELYDVGLGDDLARVLPSELLSLHPDDEEAFDAEIADLMELDFLRRLSEKGLMQYELEGTEKLARGAIILCEDGSGSMSGEREMWAKAVMLCLLHLARQQKRAFHLIHFGSAGECVHLPFDKPHLFTIDRIIEAAEIFFNGGTWFETPMRMALNLLRMEHASTGRVTADVVFVTDGECGVTPDFMKEYLDEMHRMQATTWGIDASGGKKVGMYGTLGEMTEHKVATVKDFLSGGDVRDVFRGV